MMKHDDDVEQLMLAEAREDLAKADHKASLVLAALGVGVGAVVGGILASDWKPTQLLGAGEVLWWLGTALFGAGAACAGAAVWPRYDSADASAGIYYWAHVASFSSLSSFTAGLDSNMPSLESRTRNQLWSISRIVGTKYRLIRFSIATTFFAVAFVVAGLLVGGS